MRLLGRILFAVALAAFSSASLSVAEGREAFSQVFGYGETRGDRLDAFRRWLDVLARERQDAGSYADACVHMDPNCRVCPAVGWARLIETQRGSPRLDQLRAVHNFINQRPWVDDRSNYGINDYWASPLEFLSRGGDCEDFAFAKYVSLRRLGHPVELMRLLVLNDLNAGQPHAVLLVELDGEVWVLDNLAPAIVRASNIRHFQPIYSINESGWWLHRPLQSERKVANRR